MEKFLHQVINKYYITELCRNLFTLSAADSLSRLSLSSWALSLSQCASTRQFCLEHNSVFAMEVCLQPNWRHCGVVWRCWRWQITKFKEGFKVCLWWLLHIEINLFSIKNKKYIYVCLILKFNSFLNFYTISYLYRPSLYVYRLQRYVATSVATTNTLIQLEMPHSCRAMHSDMQLTHTVWQALHEIANRNEVVGNAWNLEILQPKLFLALWRPNKPSGRLRSCPLAPPPPTSWESSKANATVPVTTSTTTTTAPGWVKKLWDVASIVPCTIIYTAPLPHCTHSGSTLVCCPPHTVPSPSIEYDKRRCFVSVVVGDKATATEA